MWGCGWVGKSGTRGTSWCGNGRNGVLQLPTLGLGHFDEAPKLKVAIPGRLVAVIPKVRKEGLKVGNTRRRDAKSIRLVLKLTRHNNFGPASRHRASVESTPHQRPRRDESSSDGADAGVGPRGDGTPWNNCGCDTSRANAEQRRQQSRANVHSFPASGYPAASCAISRQACLVRQSLLRGPPCPTGSRLVNKSLSPGTRWLSNKEDSLAAYTHALLWFITQDERHAMKSREIMDAWSAVLTHPVWAADGLEAAWTGTIWARPTKVPRRMATPHRGLDRQPDHRG